MQEYIVRVYDNRTEWFNKDGQRHREDGPAIEYANGYKAWWVNDKLHRIDGPAIEYADGSKEWYIKGKRYTEAEYHKAIAPVKEYSLQQLEDILGYPVKIIKE